MQQVGWLVLIEGRMSRGVSLWADFMLKCIGHLLLLGFRVTLTLTITVRHLPTYIPTHRTPIAHLSQCTGFVQPCSNGCAKASAKYIGKMFPYH